MYIAHVLKETRNKQNEIANEKTLTVAYFI